MVDLLAWFTDNRILEILFCAACISVLRAVSTADHRRNQRERRKVG